MHSVSEIIQRNTVHKVTIAVGTDCAFYSVMGFIRNISMKQVRCLVLKTQKKTLGTDKITQILVIF